MGLSFVEILIIIISLLTFSSALWLVIKNKPVNIYWLIIIIILYPVLGPLIYLTYYLFTRRRIVLRGIKNLSLEINRYFSKQIY